MVCFIVIIIYFYFFINNQTQNEVRWKWKGKKTKAEVNAGFLSHMFARRECTTRSQKKKTSHDALYSMAAPWCRRVCKQL